MYRTGTRITGIMRPACLAGGRRGPVSLLYNLSPLR